MIQRLNINSKNDMNTLKHLGTVELNTERLILKRISLNDSYKMFTNFAGDNKVSRYMSWDSFDNETQVYKYFVNGKRNTNKVGFNRIEAYQRI